MKTRIIKPDGVYEKINTENDAGEIGGWTILEEKKPIARVVDLECGNCGFNLPYESVDGLIEREDIKYCYHCGAKLEW